MFSEKKKYDFFHRELMALSVQQRRLDMITITSKENMNHPEKRKIVFITGKFTFPSLRLSVCLSLRLLRLSLYVCSVVCARECVRYIVSAYRVSNLVSTHSVYQVLFPLMPCIGSCFYSCLVSVLVSSHAMYWFLFPLMPCIGSYFCSCLV